MGRRQARRVPGHLQAARRQRHRYGRQDHGRAAAHQGVDAAVDRHRRPERPYADDPRRGSRRAVHTAAHDRAGGGGDLRLPAQPVGDDHSERDGAAVAARGLRADVGDGLYSRQSVADGADDLGRLRGRRRHRHAREHHPLHRGGRSAARSRAEGLGPDRLHHHLDQHLPDRGADSAAADGGHNRSVVPRIRGDAVDDHRRFGRRFADADADDGRAIPPRCEGYPPRPSLRAERTRLRRAAESL